MNLSDLQYQYGDSQKTTDRQRHHSTGHLLNFASGSASQLESLSESQRVSGNTKILSFRFKFFTSLN